jgi:hypothetical protein
VGKTFLAKILGWKAGQANQRCAVHHRYGYAQSLVGVAGGSLSHP